MDRSQMADSIEEMNDQLNDELKELMKKKSNDLKTNLRKNLDNLKQEIENDMNQKKTTIRQQTSTWTKLFISELWKYTTIAILSMVATLSVLIAIPWMNVWWTRPPEMRAPLPKGVNIIEGEGENEGVWMTLDHAVIPTQTVKGTEVPVWQKENGNTKILIKMKEEK